MCNAASIKVPEREEKPVFHDPCSSRDIMSKGTRLWCVKSRNRRADQADYTRVGGVGRLVNLTQDAGEGGVRSGTFQGLVTQVRIKDKKPAPPPPVRRVF